MNHKFPPGVAFNLEIVVNLRGFQHPRNCTSFGHDGLLPFLSCFLLFFGKQSGIVLGAELFQFDQKVAQVCLESRQVHGCIEHSFDKLCDLRAGEIRKTSNQKIGNVIAQEDLICRAGLLRVGIKQRDSDLVVLNHVEHRSQQSCMHFETGFVQSIRHHRKYVLNQRQEVLLVKGLGYMGRLSDVYEQFVKNVESLFICLNKNEVSNHFSATTATNKP